MKTATLQNFETFIAVAHSGGFTAAAEVLGISKAAVSQAVRQLESAMQVALFYRSTRKVQLTEEGKILYEQCLNLQKELEITKNILTSFGSKPVGRLKVSCNPYLADTLLLNNLKTYRQKFPKVAVEVLLEERMPDMEKEKVDIVLAINWPAPPQIVARAIGTTRYVLCASAAYLKKHGVPQTIDDLQNHHYIPHSGRSPSNVIAGLKKKQDLNLNAHLSVNHAHFMKQCALQDLGIVQLHDYMVAPELKSGQLIEVLQGYLQSAQPLYIYFQKNRFVLPKVRQFLNLFFEEPQAQYKR